MAKPLDVIVAELTMDTRPGIDGCSNVDRVHYIAEVMGVDSISLGLKFDYSGVSRCPDVDTVNASRHLALLQLDMINRAYAAGHVPADEYDMTSAELILDIQKMKWHLDHLAEGRPTPPFPFIN